MLPAPVSFTYACTSVQTSAHWRQWRWLQVGSRSRLAPPVARCFLVLLSCCSRSLSELLFYEAGSHLLPTVRHTWTFSRGAAGNFRGELLFLSVGFVLVLLISQNSVFLKISLFAC